MAYYHNTVTAESSLIVQVVPKDEHQKETDQPALPSPNNDYKNVSPTPTETQKNVAYQSYHHYGMVDNVQHQPSTQQQQFQQRNYKAPQALVETKDKKFKDNMKRFILSSLGAPGIPGASKRIQIACSAIAAPLYVILLIWGVILTFIAFDKKVEIGGHSVYIFTALVGIFFILLGIFWALVFAWSKLSKEASNLTSFSLVVTVWFVLCFYSIAATSVLTTLLVAFQEEKSFQGYHIVTFLGLGSVYVLWTVYTTVFLVNVCCNLCGKC